jgi:hypothetical protein
MVTALKEEHADECQRENFFHLNSEECLNHYIHQLILNIYDLLRLFIPHYTFYSV